MLADMGVCETIIIIALAIIVLVFYVFVLWLCLRY